MPNIVEILRKTMKENDDKRDAGLSTPAGIERFDDICYGADKKRQSLDVYRPRGAEGSLPVIVSFHGGGWIYGDKERYQHYCMDLALRGFAVVNFTYRLAPEFKFPAPVEDANLVFSWVLENAEKYGFDAENVFAVGDSAGGHGLGLYAALCTNAEYAGAFPFAPPSGFKPRAIALNCGAYSIGGGMANAETLRLMQEYLPEKGTEKELELIDVPAHVTEAFPPVFLMSAAGDFLLSQALPMARRLQEKGVEFLYRFYSRGEEELGHVFHLKIKTPEAAACNNDTAEFFRKFIK